MVVLSGVTLLSLHASVSTEDVTKEEISDGDMESSLSGESKASLEVCQESEPILLEKTGQKTGQMAYSLFLEVPKRRNMACFSAFWKPGCQICGDMFSLPEEDDSDNVEEGFAEKPRAPSRVHPSSSHRMGPFPAMQQNGWKPRWKERLPAGRKWKSIWSSR